MNICRENFQRVFKPNKEKQIDQVKPFQKIIKKTQIKPEQSDNTHTHTYTRAYIKTFESL